MQNVVSLGATKVTPNDNIVSIKPEKRNCFFENEYPSNYPLKAHQKYSQVCFTSCAEVKEVIFFLSSGLLHVRVQNQLCPWNDGGF